MGFRDLSEGSVRLRYAPQPTASIRRINRLSLRAA
jgi:hypothetical protein